MSGGNRHCYEFGRFQLDVGECQLLHDGVAVPLPPKVFEVLTVLVDRAGHLVEKDELLNLVWADTFVEEINIARIVHTLRRALGEDKNGNKFIETVAKKGYRFVAEVTKVERKGGSSENALNYLRDHAPASIAQTKQPDPDDELRIFSVENEPKLVRLKPLLFGLLGLVIVMTALIGWYVSYQRGLVENRSDAVSNNSAASRSPAYDLYFRGKVKVASENREETEAAIKLLEEAVAVDPTYAEAYAQLARGYNTMAFKYNSDSERKRYHENAEVAIEKALALNPDLAEAHFARGLVLWTKTRGFPHEQVLRSYKRSLSLNPDSDETHHQLALVYSHIGLLDEAELSVNRALEINPNNTLARFRRGVNVAYKGRFDEAIAIYKTIPRDFTPILVERSMAEALIQTGRIEEAERIVDDYLHRVPEDEGGSFNGVKALVLAKAGRHREAQDIINRAIDIGKDFGHFHHTAYNVACAYAAMDMPEEAVKWLENASDSGFPNYPYFEIDPNLDRLRKHPRYTEFMTKLRERWRLYRAIA